MRPFHHREPGLSVLGLLDSELYIEVIADGVHLHPEILRLIFNIKPLDKIILVSDSVKGPMYKGGALQGGKKTLTECVEFLAEIGIPQRNIIKAATENPKRYLNGHSPFHEVLPRGYKPIAFFGYPAVSAAGRFILQMK